MHILMPLNIYNYFIRTRKFNIMKIINIIANSHCPTTVIRFTTNNG